jgi:acyl-CoA thioester hydrolase
LLPAANRILAVVTQEMYVLTMRCAGSTLAPGRRILAAMFHYSHRVGYAECTVGNHVYYARYLDLLEAARGELFRQFGTTCLQWQERDTIFPVIECRLSYKAPARYDDLLDIGLEVTAARGIRLGFAYRITNQSGALLVEAETMHVCVDLREKPKRLPEELIALLQPYLAKS